VFIVILKRKQIFILSKGTVNGEYRINAQALKSDTERHKFIKEHTTENCRVSFYVGKNINSLKVSMKESPIPYRPNLKVKQSTALSIATRFHPWSDYIQPYLFKRNGGTYEQLMTILTKSSYRSKEKVK
jgi:hypothetical protein